MRIALTHAYSWPEVRRGAERIIHELGLALAERGHEVTVLTAGAESSRSRSDDVSTIRYRRRFETAWRHEKHFGLRLVPTLTAKGLDVVHSLGPCDALGSLRAARLRGRRRHRTVYTNLGLPIRSHWESKPVGRAHDRVVREIDAYGCMSRFALDVFANEYGRQGVLMQGGVNLSRFTPAASREPDPTILFSAALDQPQKGGRFLVDAFAMLLREEPTARLWLSGPGNPSSLLARAPDPVRERITALDIGGPQDQAERYGRAWVTALPSRNDSFGMVVVESLACGTPVAASNHSALPELVDEDETGSLCDPEDAASVATALARALALSRRPGIVDRCRAAAAPYDWSTGIAPAYERIYTGEDG